MSENTRRTVEVSDMTEKTYTLAEVREAFREGAYWRSNTWGTNGSDAAACTRYPDPEPERRWVKDGGTGYEVARTEDGKWWYRHVGTTHEGNAMVIDDDTVRARFSLLPRMPVTVTQAMVDKARAAYLDGPVSHHAMWSALCAVAADLAQPNVACQHKATRWAVVDNKGIVFHCYDETDARATAVTDDKNCPSDAPHRVIALAEVE